MAFRERASLPGTSPLAAYLLRLMTLKRTNLCLSADVSTTAELLELAEECGDSICLLKTHADAVADFGERAIRGLRAIALKKHFLIFEDRKFADIGGECTSVLVLKASLWRGKENIARGRYFPHRTHELSPPSPTLL